MDPSASPTSGQGFDPDQGADAVPSADGPAFGGKGLVIGYLGLEQLLNSCLVWQWEIHCQNGLVLVLILKFGGTKSSRLNLD